MGVDHRTFEGLKPKAKRRTPFVKFKRQVVQEYLAGETPYVIARRHDICRDLVRIWIKKFEAGELDEDVLAMDLLQQHEPTQIVLS